MFVWFDQVGLSAAVDIVRVRGQAAMTYLPQWVLLSLPNALWLASGLMVLDSIWGAESPTEKRLWLLALWCLAVGAEFGQSLRIIPGTFDWQDVGIMVIVGCCVHLKASPDMWLKMRRVI